MLLAELDRWGGLPDADRPSLLAAADRAMAWILEYGDADHDGFVEYRRHTNRGLINQGWKDSFDGINHSDGHLATPPIALCEVQGYDCAQLGIKITPAEILRELEMLIGRPVHRTVEFARRLDLTTKASRSWLSLVGVLAREAGQDDGLLRHRLAVANLQHLLVEGLLLTQPHNYADALNGDGRSASQAVVKQAIDLMRGHPETVWTTAELARATGVSGRALQKAFAKAGEPPPMTYLRQLRLNRVRAELTDASQTRSPVAVTAVASRWGFVHLGRFAQQYRQLFGEAPSQTLRSSNR